MAGEPILPLVVIVVPVHLSEGSVLQLASIR